MRLRLFPALSLLLLLTASHARAEDLLVGAQILRGEFAVRAADAGAIRILPEPVAERFVAPPVLMLHRPAEGRLDVPMVLEVEAAATGGTELEMQLIYDGQTPFMMSRRPVREGAAARWMVPTDDRMTSATLAVRGAEATTVTAARLRPLADLKLVEQLRAYQDPFFAPVGMIPVFEATAAEPLAVLQLAFHPTMRATLARQRMELRWEGQRLPITMALGSTNDGFADREQFAVPLLPGDAGKATTIELVLVDTDEVLASVVYTPDALPRPAFELPNHSIEDFHAMERNGELVIYASFGPEGMGRGASGAPLATEGTWVVAGNGEQWPLSEPVLRARRNVDWMAGGIHSFGAVESEHNIHAYFATTFSTGHEALSHANSINSLKVAAIVNNPLWMPEGPTADDMPMIRGNAVFDHRGARLVLTLVNTPGQPPEVHTRATEMRSRFIDLGPMPLADLPATATWLNGTQDGADCYLTVGPPLRLYKATDLVRRWEPVAIENAPQWDDIQLLRWHGTRWLLGIVRHAGRGVVAWMPVEQTDGGWQAVPDFRFIPPPLADLPQAVNPTDPQPPSLPTMKVETDVR